MSGLLILLIVGGMLSFISQRDVEDVIPPFVMTFLLGIYGLAILKKSHHAYKLSLATFLVIACLFIFMLARRRNEISIKALIAWPKKHIGFICFLLTCLMMVYCYSNHFVFVWDDFHYNATFPKDCFFYGTMPTGMALATYYKSYLPLMQLFFYWGFQGSGFSEPLMFQYKIVLIYVLILPLFKQAGKLKAIISAFAILVAIILPFLFMYEVQESLSMDTVVAGLFAYVVVLILFEEKRDLFFLYRVVTALLCLTLMKTISVIFAGICLATWLIVIFEKKEG
ncbi:MAG: hypothetical protein J5367_05490 [Lachnospiraceae bacterium]|nr:hypothetical protein [Lachnospiraceae bacterium]